MAHTPGPWEWKWQGEGLGRLPELYGAGQCIMGADVAGFMMGEPRIIFHGDESAANAHLIEAAPDLHEVLKEVWAFLAPQCHKPKVKGLCDKVGEALAKVERE